MKRRATAIGVGLALTMNACSAGAPASPVEAPESAPPSWAESASRQVVAAAAASVAIRGGGVQGSGEIISVNGRNMVLTAGHVGKLTTGTHCNGAEVDAILDGRAQKLSVTSSAGVYEGERLTSRDVALLGTKEPALAETSAIPLADKLPAKGENVYIVSWQPEGPGSVMGAQRNPWAGPIIRPAIVGATYQGQISGDVAVFTPNGSSYDAVDGGKIPSDTTFKDEGSGSAVVNSDGQIIAEAAKGSASSRINPAQQAELNSLLGTSLEIPYGVALGMVVSSTVVNDLATRQIVSPSECPLP